MFGKRKTPPPLVPDPYAASAERFSPKSPSEAMKPVVPPPQPVRSRRPRGGLLSMLSGALTLGLAVSATLVFGLLVVDREVGAPGPLPADKVVLVPRGAGTSEIAELLVREGVIANATLFELYAYLNRSKGQLKAGEFQFKAGIDVEDTIDILIGGKAILHAFTVPEGLTSEQIVQRLRENPILTGTVNDVPREGSLLPDTYRFERGSTRQQILNLMAAAERDALAKVWARKAPDLAIRTPQELVILASIVEKETGRGDERARVAGVFVNRLARRMKLQSDPTIVYGLVGGKGTLGRGITRAEIDRATPYNTYAIEGLPPGPIANPGRAALEAVANPAKTRDLFFVADGSGGHAFAETYDAHLRNVARWRQVERARDAAAPAGAEVDRAEPPPTPDTRSQGEMSSTLPRSAAAYADPTRANGPRPAAFDAVEGTERDPLLNRSWDLNSAKNVPAFGPPPAAAAPAAAAPRRQPPSRQRREAERAGGARDGPSQAVAQ